MLRDARQRVLLPLMKQLAIDLPHRRTGSRTSRCSPRTHGQPATPTTLGKELANFVYRLERQTEQFANVEICGKFNGAVGNFNAHAIAYPEADWPASRTASSSRSVSPPTRYTTQIEPHDWIAEYCQALRASTRSLIDLCRDIWGYISLGYFKSAPVAGEVGSSTMPHKVNPIDFENAEGNLGLANELLASSPRSCRCRAGSATSLTHGAAQYGRRAGHPRRARRLLAGLGKLDADPALSRRPRHRWEVLAEAVQTVMRRYGLPDAYEQLKDLTRGRAIDRDTLRELSPSSTSRATLGTASRADALLLYGPRGRPRT